MTTLTAVTHDQRRTADNVKKDTGSGFAALHIITTACHAVLATQFIAPSAKPAWFDGLDAKLTTAKALATQWIDELAPGLTASVPLHVVNYGTTFDAMSAEVIAILDAHPGARGKDDPNVRTAFELIAAIEDQVGRIIAEVDRTAEQLKAWGDAMQAAHDALYRGAAEIQGTEAALAADIRRLNDEIAALNAKIQQENYAIAGGAIAIGVGVFAFAVGLVVTAATGGVGAVVLVAAGTAILGGIVDWAVMQSLINQQQGQIAADLSKIADENRQIVALQGLSQAADTAVAAIATATEALSDVRAMWAFFRGELQGTLDKLEHADEALSAIVNKAYVNAARREWALATAYAQDLLKVQVTHEVEQIPLGRAA